MKDAKTLRYELEQIHNFKGKYPKQLWYLFLSEMWERFCFYGMRGMLTVFMVDTALGLGMKDGEANLRYGAIQAFIYAFTFVGGLMADKIIGFRKSLFWGGILMILGSAILAYDPKNFFLVGISFTVIGTGFFKPNISTMVGMLYRNKDNRRDAGFSIFYSGINIGALLGGTICVYVGKHYSWNMAFGFAGIVMTISLLTFIFTRKSLGPIGLSPLSDVVPNEEELDIDGVSTDEESTTILKAKMSKKKAFWYELAVYAGSLLTIPLIYIMVKNTAYTDLFMYIVGPVALIYFFYEMIKYSNEERKKLLAALLFILFSVLFWGIYEQAGGSLSLFAARNLGDSLFGIPMDPNSVNNGANSLFVIIFAFIISFVWLALAKKNKEPNTVIKFGFGFLFLGAGFLVFYALKFFAGADGISSLNVFVLAYLVVTLGELCLSPIGLSIMTKLSPTKMQGMMMGLWFLASAYGQYVAGLLGASLATGNENASNYEKMISFTDGYRLFGIYALIAGVVVILLSPFIKRLMGNVK